MISVQAFSMQKGGTGKTTSVVNLSGEYSKMGAKSLIIDGDPQGNATKSFNLPKFDLTVSALFESRNIDPGRVICKTDFENLYIIPADDSLTQHIENRPMGADQAFQRFIPQIWDQFDYVLIDVPPGVNMVSTAAMAAVDEVYLPIQCEEYALEGVPIMIKAIDKARNILNEKLKLGGAFLTMVNQRLSFYSFAHTQVKDFFMDNLLKTEIRRATAITEAQNQKMPICYYDSKNNAAIDYHNLAIEVMNRYV
jgi:chromosome partitioning protein